MVMYRLTYPPPHPARDVRVDQVSGAEVPEAEIVVTPAMIDAAHALLDKRSFFGFSCAAIYVAMERARRAEKTP